MKEEILIAFGVVFVIVIWGFLRSRSIEKQHPEEIKSMIEYDNETSKDLPFNARLHFGDSNYQKWKTGQQLTSIGCVLFIIFVLALLGVVTLK